VEDIVGLYMHPPAHAVVLSIDEKSQIQALDAESEGSRSRIRDDLAHHSDLMSLGVPR